MGDKIDFKKSLDAYQARRGTFRIVEVPKMQYLMIDGLGNPNNAPEYARALETLYPVAYKIKFLSKRELGRDYVVPPLEGLWWAEDMTLFTTARDKSQWQWTMMIMTPDWIDAAVVEMALEQAGQKAPKLDDLRLESLSEGQSVQTLHIGTFDAEGPILEQLHAKFLPKNGLEPTGKHHEVYFSDPRKAAPDKLRTLLRQPVRNKS